MRRGNINAWTTSLDGQAVRGRQTGEGTLIYFKTTGWPLGLTGLYGRKAESRRVGEVGSLSHSHPQGLSVAPSVVTWKPPVPQQLQCPTLKKLVLSHLSTWDGVNKSHLPGFISSNSHILFHQTKETSFWMISPKRVHTYCPLTSSYIDIT